MTTLADEAIQFKPGGHVCHLYETFAEQREVVVRFFQDGLNDGEHCLYITALQSPEDWYATFSDYGIDVGRYRQRRALNVIDGALWRGIGDMNSIAKAREALGLINNLLDEFNGVRIAGGGMGTEPTRPACGPTVPHGGDVKPGLRGMER